MGADVPARAQPGPDRGPGPGTGQDRGPPSRRRPHPGPGAGGRARREAAAGTLAPAFRDGLACLPDWQEPVSITETQARWHARLAELAAYRETGKDWPRHKNTDTELEHALGVWLHSQQINLRRHDLEAARSHALDTVLPGWRTGRTRGRKPQDLNTPRTRNPGT